MNIFKTKSAHIYIKILLPANLLAMFFCVLFVQLGLADIPIKADSSTQRAMPDSDHLLSQRGNRTWPLAALSRDERQRMFDLFIKPHRLSIISSPHAAAPDNCTYLLSDLERLTFLDPVRVIQFMSNSELTDLIGYCPNLHLDKKSDPVGSIELEDAEYYFQDTANMEFYDLSDILGRGYWGYFGEGGIVRCKDPDSSQLCQALADAKDIFDGPTSKIFNVETCKTSFERRLRSVRLAQNYLFLPKLKSTKDSSAKLEVKDEEMPGFFGFLTIDGVLHVLSFNPRVSRDELANQHASKSTYIGALHIDSLILDSGNSLKHTSCILSVNR